MTLVRQLKLFPYGFPLAVIFESVVEIFIILRISKFLIVEILLPTVLWGVYKIRAIEVGVHGWILLVGGRNLWILLRPHARISLVYATVVAHLVLNPILKILVHLIHLGLMRRINFVINF